MPLTGLTGEAQVRFSQLLKNGVSYRTALALADRVTDADLSVITGGGGGGGTAGVTSINGKTGVIAALAPADVGLGNVNNTSDANKPVSTATATALAAKAPIASPTFTGNVGGITKTMVGLGNVDNTADVAKPLSTAATTALAAKADLASGKVPTSQLPAIALVASVSVADQAAMLALTAAQVQPGDVAVRPDGSWMLGGTGDPAVLGNWTQIAVPGGGGAVSSVNGHTGVVVLGAADVSADASGAAATAQANAIAASMQRAANGSDIASVAAFRTALGLGSAALSPASAFDASGAATTAQANAIAVASPVPSNVAPRTRSYLPVSQGYNWKATNTRRMRTAMAKAFAGTANFNAIFMGDSKTFGSTIGGNGKAWPRRVQLALASAGIPVAGGMSIISTGLVEGAPEWSSSGSIAQNVSYIQIAAAGWVQYAAPDPGTAVDIIYVDTSAPFTYSIDGAAPVTVTPGGVGGSWGKVTVTGLANTRHTVRLNWVSGTAYWSAIGVYTPGAGSRFHNAGIPGITAGGAVGNEGWPQSTGLLTNYPAPDVVFLMYGANDENTGDSAATFATNLASLRSWVAGQWPNADIVLLAESEAYGATHGSNLTANYIPRVYDLADSADLPLVDFNALIGPQAAAAAAGLLGPDGNHETVGAHQLEANLVAGLMLANSTGSAAATLAGAALQSASNLSDLPDKRASRANIEVVRLISSPTAPAAPVSDDLWIDESTNAANGAYLPYVLNQRGAWATATTYALGDLVLAPTGDYVVPKAPFTTGAAYDASNWNIVVPAQNYGRELTGAESSADFNLNGLTGWQDIPGLTGTIPAGIPFVVDLAGLVAAVQGTAASGSIVGIQFRLTDAATATNVYAFAWRQFAYSAASGQTIWESISGLRRNAALGAATAVKAQAQVGVVTGQGNIGFFPASGGGGEPTTFLVRGR